MHHLGAVLMLSFVVLVGACADERNNGESNPAVVGYIGKETGPWFVFRTSSGISTATMDSAMGVQNFSIQAHVDSSLELKRSINISFSIISGSVAEVGMKFFPNDSHLPLFTDYRRSVKLMDFTTEKSGDNAHVRGQIVGQLFPQESLTATPDLTHPIPLVLTFDTLVKHEN